LPNIGNLRFGLPNIESASFENSRFGLLNIEYSGFGNSRFVNSRFSQPKF